MTAAAEELVVTQPSVSSAIAALGRELGCELFERSGRGIRLTDAGRAFEPYAADVIGLLESGAPGRPRSRVAVRPAPAPGRGDHRRRVVRPAAHARLRRPSSGDRAYARVGNRQQVLERLCAHVVDIAISGTPPADPRLIAEPLMRNDIVCITHPGDPALSARRLDSSELADRVWLLREPGSGTRTLNEQFLSERGLSPETLTIGSNGAIRQAARVGLGVALLSRSASRGTSPPAGWPSSGSGMGRPSATGSCSVTPRLRPMMPPSSSWSWCAHRPMPAPRTAATRPRDSPISHAADVRVCRAGAY